MTYNNIPDRPVCDCGCDKPMVWKRDKRYHTGGYFRCSVLNQREAARRSRKKSYRRKKWRLVKNARDRQWRRDNPELKKLDNSRRLNIGSRYYGMIHDDEVRKTIKAKGDALIAEFNAKQAVKAEEAGVSLRHVYER